MVRVRLYVEGGGEGKALKTACRRGFRELFEKAGLAGAMPRIIASGSRRSAYDDFCTALSQARGDCILLLVDSEGPVARYGKPWEHLQERVEDRWPWPDGATDDQCHLMVQCMESWFLADRPALAAFFGQGFNDGALPKREDVEAIPKTDVLQGLHDATRHARPKGVYRKGPHAFDILALIDPRRLRDASRHADRLLATLANPSVR